MGFYGNELDEFIYEKCYQYIWDAVYNFVGTHPMAFFDYNSRLVYPAGALLKSMLLEFSSNVRVDENELCFDATFSCSIEFQGDDYSDYATSDYDTWITVSCRAIIEDTIQQFDVANIHTYKRGQYPSRAGLRATKNMVPVISTAELETEADRFLDRYYPEALREPMAVPIEEIAKTQLGLTVLKGHRLTHDFSIFGQICFADTEVTVFDLFDIGEETITAKRGTIFVDAYTFWERNLGCVNNTIAHEVFHWYRHRLYASIKHILHGEKVVPHRCPTDMTYPGENEEWTDEQRMEWQANKLAPRILMPRKTFCEKVDELYHAYQFHDSPIQAAVMTCIIDELASFFKVSKQSAMIRMLDLGYKEAGMIQAYEETGHFFTNITDTDAFYEYADNPEFRKLIDSGLFRFIDGYFVINDEKYVTVDEDGSLHLNDYAWSHLAECTLQFTYRQVNMKKHGEFHTDLFHRENGDAYQQLPQYDSDKNTAVVLRAEELSKLREDFEARYADHKEMTQTFWERAYSIMQKKKWNTAIFCEKTQLNEMTYSRAKNNFNSNPDVRTVISICAGLDLDLPLTTELLGLAGHTLSNTREHQAYGYVISVMKGRTIHERNQFLESVQVPLLGSKDRR